MSMIQVTCNCGWTIMSNDQELIRDATRAHDETCPFLFVPDKVVEG